MVGFGIVGCGLIANFHARAIAEIRGARLVACFSRREALAQSFAESHSCQAMSELRQLIEHPQIHVVCICTPSGGHAEPAVAAARAGKHVIVEKPLEVTLRRCDRILDTATRHGVVVSTVFQSRFHPSTQRLKRAVDQGRFGRLVLGDAHVKWYRPQSYYDGGAWRGTWRLDGGGALMNQAIHTLDLLLWLMGPVESVTAHAATRGHRRIEVEDVAAATFKFRSGALGCILATTASFPGSPKKIEIHGDQGTAVLEDERFLDWRFAKPRRSDQAMLRGAGAGSHSTGGAAHPADIGHHGHAAQFRDVLQAIRQNREPLIDGRQGRAAVELVLAIYQAAQTGRVVTLPLSRDPHLSEGFR